MKPQLHLEPIANKNGFGTLAEWIELHTYDEPAHCYATFHGSNMEDHSQTVEMLLPEGEVRSLRDALNEVLGATITLARAWCNGWEHPDGSRAEHPPHIWTWGPDKQERYCSGRPDQEEDE